MAITIDRLAPGLYQVNVDKQPQLLIQSFDELVELLDNRFGDRFNVLRELKTQVDELKDEIYDLRKHADA